MLAEAKALLAQAQALHGAASEVSGEMAGAVHGALTLGSLVTVAPVILPKLRRRFEAAHPNAKLHHFIDDRVVVIGGTNWKV